MVPKLVPFNSEGLTAFRSLSNRKVQVAVIIVVSPGRAVLIPLRKNAGSPKDICERPITIVLIQIRGFIKVIVHEQINVPIIIEITPNRITKRISRSGTKPGRGGSVGKNGITRRSPGRRHQMATSNIQFPWAICGADRGGKRE